jgi:hypothetical protein
MWHGVAASGARIGTIAVVPDEIHAMIAATAAGVSCHPGSEGERGWEA